MGLEISIRLISIMDQFQNHNDHIAKLKSFLVAFPSIRMWKKHVNIISAQIYFTANGYKLGYLWDAGPIINSTTLQIMLNELVRLGLIPGALRIFEICTEIFLINQNQLNKIIQNNTTANIPFIDVTKTLSIPQLLNTTDEAIDKITNFIKLISDKCNKDDKLPTQICMPTVIGILIGYPIVYWYNAEISDENNLNNSRLKVFQLCHNGSIIYSFSVPYDLISQNNILSQYVSKWLDEKSQFGFQIETFITEAGFVIICNFCKYRAVFHLLRDEVTKISECIPFNLLKI